jgi:ferredoxin
MQSTIYWFSGTGNSLYAAKKLAETLGDTELVSMADSDAASQSVGGAVGFVFPSYFGDLPRIVRAYVENLSIAPGTDVFAVVTMGALGEGSIKSLAELLRGRGLTLRYGVGIRMPANYIIKYNPAMFGARSDNRLDRKLRRADKKLQKLADDIASGTRRVKTSSITSKAMYTDVPSLDSGFSVSAKCTGCGLCERVCPVKNIAPVDGKPTWQHRCEHCVACISWCPVSAIEFGGVTQKRTRYRNPRVRYSELARPDPTKLS